MWNVSADLLTALRSSSIRVNATIITSTGITLNFRSGSVGMDARRNTTRTCELELLPSATMNAQAIYELVMTPGLELFVTYSVWNGSTFEPVPLGVFTTNTSEVSVQVSGAVSWSGSDRSAKISRAKFIDPYSIASGTTLAEAGTTLLQSRFAGTPCDFDNVIATTSAPITFDPGGDSDPWQCARDLFNNHGYDLNFDGSGQARATPIPDPQTATAAFDFGNGALLVDGSFSGSLEGTFSGVIATGEGSWVTAPPRAEAWDTDPTSPTYYLGSFGKVPLFHSSPMITTTDQAQEVASTMLAKLKGRTQGLTFTSIVNPALEPLDVVSATINGSVMKFAIDALTIPLQASEAMQVNAREVGAS